MMKRALTFFLISALGSACGMAQSDSDDSGGNVGFGGAQDIGQFRGILDDGGIPGENTLDANGFFSEHYTELPPADCGQIVCLESMLAVGRDWRTDQYQAALQVSLSTTVDPAELERLPLNLVVVVDTSGSMSADNRIGFVKQGLHLLVDQLEDGDRLSVVRYASNVEVLSSLEATLDRAALHDTVDALVAAGATNIHGGLKTGFELAGSAFDPARQNRVILLSDGLATSGITDDASIQEMAVGFIADGIGLTTIGVGTDFNVELMRGLAERGAGNFYFLEDAQAITEVFVDELTYFVTPLALGVQIEVLAGSSYDLGEVVGTRLWKTEGRSGSVFIPGVFVASRTDDQPDEPGGRRGGGGAIFLSMTPRDGVFEAPDEVARVRLSYRLPGETESIEQVITVRNPGDPGVVPDEDLYLSHQAMAEHYAAYNVFLGLRDATRSAAWDYHCAMTILADLDRDLAAWNQEFADEDIAADRALIQQFMGNLELQGARIIDDASAVGQCANDGFFDPEIGELHGDDEVYLYACSASGSSGAAASWILVLLVLVALRRRRQSVA